MGQVDFRDSVGAMPPALPSRGYGSVPARAGLCDVPSFAGGGAFSWGDDRLENALSRAREGRLAAV